MTTSVMMTSCARQPSYKRSQRIVKKFFKKYGKEYKKTVYGQSKVESVEVLSQQEVHKDLVGIEAFITLEDGTVRRIHATVEVGPVGWRFVSWENAS